MKRMAVTNLSDGSLQFWVVDNHGFVQSAWQQSPGMTPFTPLSNFGVALTQALVAGPLPDKRVQFWNVHSSDQVLGTTWNKLAAPQDWSSSENPMSPDPGPVSDVSAGQLSDERLQLWAVSIDSTLLSSWGTSAGGWTEWQTMSPNPGQVLAGAVAAGQLSDKRLQLWVAGQDNVLRTTWKISANPDDAWANWETMSPDPGPVLAVAVGKFGNITQLFAVGTDNVLRTSVKQSADAGSNWSAWQSNVGAGPLANLLQDVVVGQVAGGSMQLWALGVKSETGAVTVWTSTLVSSFGVPPFW